MTGCTEYRHALGALAVGALDASEADRVRAHADRCADCAAELRDLQETVLALAAVPADAVGVDGTDTAPSPRLLPALLGRVRRERLRRRVVVAAAAAAVAVLAGIGGAVVGGAIVDGDAEETPPSASAVGTEAGVEVEVLAWDRGWGTAVQAVVSGVPAGSRCSLVAVGPDGSEEIAATWAVPDDEYDGLDGRLVVDGAVGLRSWDVDHYAIVTSDGRTLVTTEPS